MSDGEESKRSEPKMLPNLRSAMLSCVANWFFNFLAYIRIDSGEHHF